MDIFELKTIHFHFVFKLLDRSQKSVDIFLSHQKLCFLLKILDRDFEAGVALHLFVESVKLLLEIIDSFLKLSGPVPLAFLGCIGWSRCGSII